MGSTPGAGGTSSSGAAGQSGASGSGAMRDLPKIDASSIRMISSACSAGSQQ
jgi:hypothetical protein